MKIPCWRSSSTNAAWQLSYPPSRPWMPWCPGNDRLPLRDSPPPANAVTSGALAANARVAPAAAPPEVAAVVALGVVGGPGPALSRQPRGRLGGALLGLSAVALPPRVQGPGAGVLRLAPPALRG